MQSPFWWLPVVPAILIKFAVVLATVVPTTTNATRPVKSVRVVANEAPSQGFLTDRRRDEFAVIGLLGTAATFIGFAVTLVQIQSTKSAAERAREAAEETLKVDRRRFGRFAIFTAHRFLKEAQIHYDVGSWKMVAYRLDDLAEQTAQVSRGIDDPLASWAPFADELRSWANTFRRIETKEITLTPSTRRKWASFAQRVSSTIDSYNIPFEPSPREASR